MRAAFLVVAISAVAFAAFWWMKPEIPAEVAVRLEGLGKVAVVGTDDFRHVQVSGTTFSNESDLSQLRSEDGPALARELTAKGYSAIIVPTAADATHNATNLDRLKSLSAPDDFRAVYLHPQFALYTPAFSARLDESTRAILPRAARLLLEGVPAPRMSRFPEALREIQNVEVMVLLRDRGEARLWRSSRGSSVIRALITAATVARQRWTEREAAMGGPLRTKLPELDVEVYLLEEDGTLGSTADSFIRQAFKSEHGVAYERPGTWRYLLPSATQERGAGDALQAFAQLFSDNGLAANSLQDESLRFYRLVETRLGVSNSEQRLGNDPLAP